ncbi:MAG TPA: YhjD/YihY/BrkB family envelope integrity protein, partial [Bryobacteraceae bacterium]|nr:YhjD/YihY/BrkB family envelope integrity protein [Bryobacteraceae bacterium]
MSAQSVWQLIKHTAGRWNAINAPQLGAALAFYTMTAIAPLLVVCVGIAGMVFGAAAARGEIASQVQNLVGPAGAAFIQSMLRHVSKPSSGILAASVGFFMLLFGASGVFLQLRDSLNAVWGVKAGSSGLTGMVKYRFYGFLMVLGVGFLLLVSLALSASLAAAGKFFGG